MGFIPDSEKTFPFQAGDILLSVEKGLFRLSKILKVEEKVLFPGETIGLAGQLLTAPERDSFLIIHVALGRETFPSEFEGFDAYKRNTWERIGHVPMRPSGFSVRGCRKLGTQAVTDEELEGYRHWKTAFDAGRAGVF